MSGPIRAIVVDDEPLARAGIRVRLAEHTDFAVVAEASNGPEAITAIGRHSPDVVFLDVQMPGLDGLQVSTAIRGPAVPLWIFVSAYAEHAVSAFGVEALDYLVKPIDNARFSESLARIRRRLQARPPQDSAGSTFVVRSGNEKVLLSRSEIVWLQSAGDWVVIHTHHSHFRLRARLSAIAAALGPAFVRIHRSTVISRASAAAIMARPSGEFVVRLTGGAVVTSSRRYRAQVRSLLHPQPSIKA